MRRWVPRALGYVLAFVATALVLVGVLPAPAVSGQVVPTATSLAAATATPTPSSTPTAHAPLAATATLVGTATAGASATTIPTATPNATETSPATPQPTNTATATTASAVTATVLSTGTATFIATTSATATTRRVPTAGATSPAAPGTPWHGDLWAHPSGGEPRFPGGAAGRAGAAPATGTSGTVRAQTAATGPGAPFTSLAAGDSHSCGLEAGTGKAWCWGANWDGRLGDGTTATQFAPVAVTGGRAFSSLAAGGSHTCGVEAGTGKAWCWGYNGSGQLGDGTTAGTPTTAPVAVTGGRTFTTLAAGDSHTCGVEAVTGKAWCWGSNYYGQLGDGTTANRGAPVAVEGGRAFASLAAGGSHTCGVEAVTGKAWCWGRNGYGQLGYGGATGWDQIRSAPVEVSGGKAFASLVAGDSHTCGVEVVTGKAWCWGWNYYGQLGDGTTANRGAPVAVEGGRAFASLAAGGSHAESHACGVEAGTGKAWCWGWNRYGQLGSGTVDRATVPVVATGGRTFASLAAGDEHTCGVEAGTGNAWCWGSNENGRLGDGTTTDRGAPVAVEGGRAFASVAAGWGHTCALEAGTGKAWCWGYNGSGQLGDGTTANRAAPVAVEGGRAFASLVAGWGHACALEAGTGKAWCWGSNLSGQLGVGTTANQSAPAAVSGNRAFASLAVGGSRSCGVESGTGKAWCWGSNGYGQLGDGTTANQSAPVAVSGNRAFASLAAGQYHACGVEAVTGATWCWGGNWNGQLGDGTYTDRTAPVAMAMAEGRAFTSLAVGQYHTCGVEVVTGKAWCWGYRGYGQLGNPSVNDRWVAVEGGRAFASLVAGDEHTCGVEAGTGKAWCWGGNYYGQLGDGTFGNRIVPVANQFEPPPAIRSIRVANVRDTSFTVSWVTDVSATGAIRWGLDDGTAPANVAPDRRGASGTFTVHLATVSGLAPSTRYRFDVTSGPTTDTNGGAHYLVTTGPTLASVPSPDQSRGTVSRRDGTVPDGVLVHLTASGTSGTSAPLVALVTAAEVREWAANLGNLRTASLDAAFPVTDATIVAITADGGADGTAGAGTTVATARAGTLALTLGDQADVALATGWNLVALRVAPSPAVTASGACVLTNARVPGAVVEVVRWIAGAWESHRCGFPPNDFALEPGAGYFVRTTVPAAWPTWGTAVTTAVSRTLGPGWNLVGASATLGTPTTAPGACTVLNTAQAGSALEVVRWVDGGWEAHSCGFQTNRFTLQAGVGYFVRMATGGTLAPVGAAQVSAASVRR